MNALTGSNLLEKYNEMTRNDLVPSVINPEGESILTLCKTSWVRVLIVRKYSGPDSVEVELSLPDCDGSGMSPYSRELVDSLLSSMKKHLEYLERLLHEGFRLDLIANDCLWTASYEIRKSPEKEFFDLLVPPSC
jgi:hypothetical protein